jgi:hypothetical protein
VIPAANGTVAATYVAGTSISGTVSFSAGTVSFSGAPIPSTTYDYNIPAQLADITGSWTLTALDGSTVALTIAGSGSFTAMANGCSITGTFSPRASGKNVFNLALTFGAAPCASPGATASGVAVSNPIPGGKRQLIVVGVNATRTAGTALFGNR